MKKYGFQVSINSKTICRAGFESENSVLTCILDSIRRENDTSEELNISISGLNSDTNQHADWFQNTLRHGDKISIEVISEDFDPPNTIRESRSGKKSIEQKLEYFHKLKEELKDHL